MNMFDWVKKNYYSALAFLSVLILPVVCFGADPQVADFSDFSTYFSAMAGQVQSAITTVIPYVLPLVGIMLAIMVGIRVVKRITGKA
ncbi:MAG: hypothetical protein WBJ17_05915 [Natronincolaceae bacterium]